MTSPAKFLSLALLLAVLLSPAQAAIITGTCPCRARTTAGVSLCAEQAGDPNWCNFHMCAPGFECIDPAWATHTCEKKETYGIYKCLFDDNGMVIKPRPHETTRCKCEHDADRVVHHVTPIA